MAADGNTRVSYTYGVDGTRYDKTVNGVTHYYIWADGKPLEEYIAGNTGPYTSGDTLFFFYDQNGRPYVMQYNGSTYYYVLNLQGDVIWLVDGAGSVVASYEYDPYGNIISASGTMAQINPLRYRGYYYESETGLYYVSSRYYDPEIGRWINADALVDQSSVLGYDLFAYCRNNPVNMTDTTGNLPFFAITAAIGAVVGAVVGGVVAAKNGGNVWAGIGIGAAAGALIGTGAGMAAGAALAGSITATIGAVLSGGSTLVATVATSGVGAGIAYMTTNFQQATNAITSTAHTASDPLKNALKQLDSSGLRPGQTEISRNRVMELVNNFDPSNAQSSINSIDGTRYLVEGHHTTVASTILGRGTCMNMGTFTNQLPSATNIYWTKHWYEIWETAIKIME